MNHRFHPMHERLLPITSLVEFLMHVFNKPKCEAMDKVSCNKKQGKVMTLGENIELLHRLEEKMRHLYKPPLQGQ